MRKYFTVYEIYLKTCQQQYGYSDKGYTNSILIDVMIMFEVFFDFD